MASEKQIEANRRNAEKSTGPKTAEGKAASRGNALKHGLSGDGAVCTAAVSEELTERLELWKTSFQAELADGPNQVERRFLFVQAVLNSLRIETAQRREFEIHETFKQRAQAAWDDDHTMTAETIGAKLPKSPSPSLLIAQLCTFLQGIQWLIREWTHLKDAIDHAGAVGETQAARFWDLLGTPRDMRDHLPKLEPAETRKQIDERLEQLQGDTLPRFEQLDAHERRAAENGFASEISREERLNRRYEDLAQKRYRQSCDALRRLAADALSKSPPPSVSNDPIEKTEEQDETELDAKPTQSVELPDWPSDRGPAPNMRNLMQQFEEIERLILSEDESEQADGVAKQSHSQSAMTKERRKQKKAQRQNRDRNRRRR